MDNDKFRQFKLPSFILEKLNEFSSSGFILITSDQSGEPQIYMTSDNTINSLALQKYVQLWAETLDELTKESIAEQMIQTEESDIPEDLDEENL